MKYDDFRSELKFFLSSQKMIQTLKQGKEFEAIYKYPEVIVIPSLTRRERPININEFHKIWQMAKNLPKHEQFNPVNYTKDTVNASYILTLFKLILKEEKIE